MTRANEIGMTHLAITDHGTLSGHREFQKHAKTAGIKPILGCEMYISETGMDDRRPVKKRDDNTQAYNHLTVVAQNEVGLKNLNHLSEIAWKEGFYSKPRIDMDALEENNEGLVVLSGCLNGLISKAIDNNSPLKARQHASEFKRVLGDRFFIEIQGHNPPEINAGLLQIAKEFDVLPVVTSDCHYAREEDLWLQDATLILSTGPLKNRSADFSKSQQMDFIERYNYLYPDRKMTFQEYKIFLRSYEEHRALLEKQGIGEDPIRNTMVVADMIGDYPFYENLDLLPNPVDGDPNEALWDLVNKGAAERGTLGRPEYDARRQEEMDIIIGLNFARYFLIEADVVQWGKSEGIMFGPGRGSGAGSLVNYELGITGVDPIEHNLLFFRFLNPERNDYPDIDTDVEITKRSEVKNYVVRKYEHAASIATFGVRGGKKAVRDAARVFDVPLGEVNKALKGADWVKGWWDEFDKTDRGREFMRKYPEVNKLARFLYGRVATQGMHAGGLVVANRPISELAPMQTSKDASDESETRIPLVAYDMDSIQEIGLIKYDFLGLKALTILSDTIDMVKERHGKDIDLYKIPLDDMGVYYALSHGETKGVFQCEATPYTNLLIRMGGVRNFDELAASNALVRPGAMDSTAGAAFIARKMGQEQIDYAHQVMQPFTKETYGVVIYQEQVMQTMTELAGMTMATADKVRKIIGKKRDVTEFEQYRAEFIEGASEKVTRRVADSLWHDFEAHANYSFNKSHAVAYSLVSYWTAWLKKHYTLEFMTAVLRNEGDKDAVLDYLIEVKRLGIKVKLPHVNASELDFAIQANEEGEFIRMGLSNIKFISKKLGGRLMQNRPYANYDALQKAVFTKGSGLNTRVLGSLNAVGSAAFEDNPLRGNERDNFFEYLNIPAFPTQDLPATMKMHFRTLDEYSEDEAFVVMAMVRSIKTGQGWQRAELVDETGTVGCFLPQQHAVEAGNMYVLLISNNRVARYVTVKDLLNDQGGDFQEFLEAASFPDVPESMLRVVSFTTRITKANKRMAEVVFSDEYKNLTSALVFPKTFMQGFSRLQPGATVDVKLEQTQESDTYFVSHIL